MTVWRKGMLAVCVVGGGPIYDDGVPWRDGVDGVTLIERRIYRVRHVSEAEDDADLIARIKNCKPQSIPAGPVPADPVSALIPADGELSHPGAVAFSPPVPGVSGASPVPSHCGTGPEPRLKARENPLNNSEQSVCHGEAAK